LKIAVVTHVQVVSHLVVAHRIAEVFKKLGHECKVYNFEEREIPEENVLFVGTVFAANLSYLTRFLPEKKVVFYGTCEGFPFIDPGSAEKRVAESMPIVAVSSFVRMCLETVGVPVAAVVHHGLDMAQIGYDGDYYEYLKKFIKGSVVFCNSANSERKGLDRLMIAAKLVCREDPNAFFILHSGEGYVSIPKMMQDLELQRFWYTNSFGMFPWEKLNCLYKLCAVLVQPSYCGGFELPIIEGFRYNKPAVAVDVEPYNEIIDNGKTGLLIPCKRVVQHRYMDRFMFPLHIYSVDELADAIGKILSDNQISQKVENFDEAKKKFDAVSCYSKLLDFF